jgi:hypothetical protein
MLASIPRPVRSVLPWLLVAVAAALPVAAGATTITFSGTVSYDGAYSGDSLYVAVLDTTGTEDVTLLGTAAMAAPAPPFGLPYSINFDNAGLSAPILIASFLDVDGGGLADVSGVDVFGYYAGSFTPVGVSPTTSHSGLDFSLPKAEIHGTITFAGGQGSARVDASSDCIQEGFRPQPNVFVGGAYSIVGLYPGTYCVSADGNGLKSLHVCYADPTCASPTLVTLTTNQVRTGIDLDFSAASAVDEPGWGRLKSTYR